jgi:hypothetical protein
VLLRSPQICTLLGPASGVPTPPANVQNLHAAASLDPNATAAAMAQIQTYLLQGQREAALRTAMDAREWPLALLLASVCDRGLYQQVVKVSPPPPLPPLPPPSHLQPPPP